MQDTRFGPISDKLCQILFNDAAFNVKFNQKLLNDGVVIFEVGQKLPHSRRCAFEGEIGFPRQVQQNRVPIQVFAQHIFRDIDSLSQAYYPFYATLFVVAYTLTAICSTLMSQKPLGRFTLSRFRNGDPDAHETCLTLLCQDWFHLKKTRRKLRWAQVWRFKVWDPLSRQSSCQAARPRISRAWLGVATGRP